MNPISISYKLGCRNCLESDGQIHSLPHRNDNLNELMTMTEYDLASQIEEFRRQNNECCKVCRSTNMEVLDVAINFYPLYDHKRIADKCISDGNFMIQITIQKRDFDITKRLSMAPRTDKDFLAMAIKVISSILDSKPDDEYKSHHVGKYYICIICSKNSFTNQSYLRVERLEHVGLSKDEIINVIRPIANDVYISI